MQGLLEKAGRLLLTAVQAGVTAGQLSVDTSKDALRQASPASASLIFRLPRPSAAGPHIYVQTLFSNHKIKIAVQHRQLVQVVVLPSCGGPNGKQAGLTYKIQLAL